MQYRQTATGIKKERRKATTGLCVASALVSLAPATIAQSAALGSVYARGDIKYRSVAEAYHDISRQVGVERLEVEGWKTFIDNGKGRGWYFSTPKDLAYPALIMQEVKNDGGGHRVKISILCQDKPTSCAQLHQRFVEMKQLEGVPVE